MTLSELKIKVANLWKECVPGENDAFIKLMLDNYLVPEFAACNFNGSQLISFALGIPFCFGNGEKSLKGMCIPIHFSSEKFRHRGEISRLIDDLNHRAKSAGFAFSFVMPVRNGLERFYRNRGFVNGFFKVIDNYTSVHNFNMEFDSFMAEQKEKVAILKRRFYDTLEVEKLSETADRNSAIDNIISFVTSLESTQSDLRILHSPRDLRTAILANEMKKGEVIFVHNNEAEITGGAFCVPYDRAVVVVKKIFVSDAISKLKLLDGIKKSYPDLAMEVNVPTSDMDRKAVWSRAFGSALPEAPAAGAISISECVYSLAAHAKMIGMVRILDLSEILKFMAADRHDLKYSILVKEDSEGFIGYFKVAKGKLSVEEISPDQFNSLPESVKGEVMSLEDVAEIIFRRRDGDNLITEAFGIPSINATAALLF